MASKYDEVESDARQAAFQPGFVWAALAMALGAGFAIGAHLTFVLGFGFPVGQGFASFVQTHGHVQLVGWAGLMIMGISLHFIPRLTGVPLARPRWPGRILWLMVLGLGLRSIGQPVVPYLTGHFLFVPMTWLLAASGVLEWGGILLYVLLLVRTCCGARRAAQRPAPRAVQPYFGMMAAGWLLYGSLNLVLLVSMARTTGVVVHAAWNQVAIESFIGLVLLPVAFALSVRMLPLYLRLAVPDWPVRGTAYAYLVTFTAQILPDVPPVHALAPQVAWFLTNLGMLLKGVVILWFVWQLDLLTRRRAPWTVRRQRHPGPERRPTRPGLPDYGEFGRFEGLVYAAYAWLVLAAGCESVAGLTALLGQSFFVSSATIRHMYVLGFVTLLILGMAVRMLPGFLHQRRVASPALVTATFWLGNAAVLCRVLPFLLPPIVLQRVPGSAVMARTAFAISGLLGLAAVGCLAVNLWRTARAQSSSQDRRERGTAPPRHAAPHRLSPARLPLLVLGMLALLTALWGGLARLGWALPLPHPTLPLVHGPLIVCGFLGTLIGVERAVALGTHWPYIAPLLTAVGALALLIGLPASPLMTLGSLGLVAVFAVIVRRQCALATIIMALGALLWLAGNSLWLAGWPLVHVVPWWSGFLVLTIAGERLELSRMLRLTRGQHLGFLLAVSLFVGGFVLLLVRFASGVRLTGVGMVALAWWLLRYDVARRTVRQAGLTHFIAVCLLSGYVWLGVGGVFNWCFAGVLAGPAYDAMLHTVFVGFVLAMIFGHAPIILPAILRRTPPYHAALYAPLALLHASLLLRVVGNLVAWWPGRQWGGLLNAVAVLLFLSILARGLRQGQPTAASPE